MQQAYFVVRSMLALGIALLLGACSGAGSSETITPPRVAADSQTRLTQSALRSGAAGFAYTANNVSNDVSAFAIDATTVALTPATGLPFAAGTSPTGVTVDPTGKFAYVTNNNYLGSGNVSSL